MAVYVSCPSCGVKLNIPEDYLGKKVRCASCSTVFEAKVDAAPRPPPPIETPLQESIREELPPAPLGEEPARKRDWGDDDRERDRDREEVAEHEDYDDSYDDEDKRRRRARRRDLAPHRGGLIMGLGIGSAVTGVLGCCCGFLPVVSIPLGVCAWIMGQGDMKKIDQGMMDPDGRGNTQAGFICGIVGVALGALRLVGCVVQIAFMGLDLSRGGF